MQQTQKTCEFEKVFVFFFGCLLMERWTVKMLCAVSAQLQRNAVESSLRCSVCCLERERKMQPIKRLFSCSSQYKQEGETRAAKEEKKSLIITWTQFARDDLILSWEENATTTTISSSHESAHTKCWSCCVDRELECMQSEEIDFHTQEIEKPNVKWKSHKSNERRIESTREEDDDGLWSSLQRKKKKNRRKKKNRITFFCETLLDFYPLIYIFLPCSFKLSSRLLFFSFSWVVDDNRQWATSSDCDLLGERLRRRRVEGKCNGWKEVTEFLIYLFPYAFLSLSLSMLKKFHCSDIVCQATRLRTASPNPFEDGFDDFVFSSLLRDFHSFVLSRLTHKFAREKLMLRLNISRF